MSLMNKRRVTCPRRSRHCLVRKSDSTGKRPAKADYGGFVGRQGFMVNFLLIGV
jgi:hypothetical protein